MVTRTWSYASPEKDRFGPRLLNYGTFMVTALTGIFSEFRPDLVLVYSPPLFLGLTAAAVKTAWKCPFVFWVNDLWPRAAISLGFMKEGPLYRLAAAMERFIYREAARVFVYSQRMAAEIEKTGLSGEKIECHPLWIDDEVFAPDFAGAEGIRKNFGWQDKFVVLYGGNLGLAQGLDVLIESARLLRDIPDIYFVLVGSGVEKENLEQLMKKYGLSNVAFVDHQPKEKVRTFFSGADLLFAHLKAAPHRVGTVPEKLLAYMACGRPVLMAAQPGAATDLIEANHCGLTAPPEDPKALAQAIMYGRQHRQQVASMGIEGRQAVESQFAGSKVLKAMETSLSQIASLP